MNFFEALAVVTFALLVAYLIWSAHSRYLKRDIGGRKTDLTVIVASFGSPAELEQSVRGLMRLMTEGTLDPKTKIVIQNAWSSAETAEMARILEMEYEPVTIAEG